MGRILSVQKLGSWDLFFFIFDLSERGLGTFRDVLEMGCRALESRLELLKEFIYFLNRIKNENRKNSFLFQLFHYPPITHYYLQQLLIGEGILCSGYKYLGL